jgi:hypothetical protein
VAKFWKTRTGSAALRTVTGEANVFCLGGGGSEDDGRGGVEVFDAVVLAEAEGVEADFVCQLDLLEELEDAFLRSNGVARDGIWNQCCEAVDTDLHLCGSLFLC